MENRLNTLNKIKKIIKYAIDNLSSYDDDKLIRIICEDAENMYYDIKTFIEKKKMHDINNNIINDNNIINISNIILYKKKSYKIKKLEDFESKLYNY